MRFADYGDRWKMWNCEHSRDVWGTSSQRCSFTPENWESIYKFITWLLHFRISLSFVLFFWLKTPQTTKPHSKGRKKPQLFSLQVLYVRKHRDWKRCWSCYAAAVLLQWRTRKVMFPNAFNMKKRASLCGFYYVHSARRKELSLVGFSFKFLRSAICVTKFSTDF